MASVSLDFKAFTDGRFKVLGSLLKIDKFSARARCEELYRHCVEECSYLISGMLIDALAEADGFAEAMVKAGLASKFEKLDDDTIGPALPEGQYRICGTKGRVEYLAEARVRQKAATEAAAEKRRLQREKSNIGTEVGSKDGSNVGSYLGSNSPPLLESYSTSASSSASAPSQKTEEVRNQTHDCVKVWGETLSTWGIPDTAAKADEMEIGRLIAAKGFEQTRLALLGARYEEKSEGFDPKKHPTLARFWKPGNFSKFVKLGIQAEAAEAERISRRAAIDATLDAQRKPPPVDDGPPLDREKVHAILAANGIRLDRRKPWPSGPQTAEEIGAEIDRQLGKVGA